MVWAVTLICGTLDCSSFSIKRNKQKRHKAIPAFLVRVAILVALLPIGQQARSGFREAVSQQGSTGALHLIVRVSHSKDKSRESKRSFGFYGPSGETRTRGILVPKYRQNLYIVYSVFLGRFSLIRLLSSNFFSTQFFYFRHISGQISGHKSALPSKRNRSSTEKIASK